MPGLPDLMQSSAPVPVARGGVASYQPQQNQVGQILRGTASELSEAANIVAATNDRQDAIVAQAAANNLAAARMQVEFDPKEGFRSVKEGGAVGQSFVKDYTQKFTDSQTLLRTGLENDNQRRIFDQHAQLQSTQFKGNLLQHQAQETEKFNDSTADNALKLQERTVAQRPNDEQGFQQAVVIANGIIASNGKRKGLPPEAITELKAVYKEKMLAGRIVSIMQGLPGILEPDPYAAALLFKQVEGDLGPATINRLGAELTQSIKAHTDSAIAQSEGAALAEQYSYTQTGAALKVIDGMSYTPAQKTAIRAELEHRHAVQQSDADKGNALIVGKVSEMVYSGMSRARITASPEFQQARDKGAILKMIDDKAYSDTLRANATDARAISALQRHETELHITQAAEAFKLSAPDVLHKKPREQIEAMLPVLGQRWTHELLAKKDAMEKAGGSKEAKMDKNDIDAVAKEFFGIDPQKMNAKEYRGAMMDFQSRVEQIIARKGQGLDRDEKYKLIAGEAARTVATGGLIAQLTGGRLGTTDTPVIRLQPADIAKIEVPKDARFRIIEKMKARYQSTQDPMFAPTEANVQYWWAAQQSPNGAAPVPKQVK